MKTFVGLDVSQKKTSVCVIDHNGNKIRMANVDTHPRLSLIISFLKVLISQKSVWKQGRFASGFTIRSRVLAWTLIVSTPGTSMPLCRCS
ncbi:hypothetical protein ACQFN5_08270 [Klebsiella sp. WOUb02]|uniref:hypothetical protein n=1 Tax=Klebsiella sp. WOUb02 TaxID=3161071 RepID=UPI003CF08C84